MKVILQKDVPNLGDAGDIKDVANGYARNYLIPRKMVLPALGNSARAAEHHKKIIEMRIQKRVAAMEELAGQMKSVGEVEMPVRVGQKGKLYGSITTTAIAAAITAKGFPLDKRKIELNESIKALGNYNIKVRLAEKIIVPVVIKVIPDEASVAAIEEENKRQEAENARLERAKGGSPKPAKTESAPVEASGETAGAEVSGEQ
jgi:large subunit ribosomal protein L9